MDLPGAHRGESPNEKDPGRHHDLRLLDISNARDVRQIGYYRVTGTDPESNPSSNSWDLAWNGRYVYLFDMNRGIEVLKLRRCTHDRGVSRLAGVTAPSVRSNPFASVPVGGLWGNALVCPAFENSKAARSALRRERGLAGTARSPNDG